MNSFSFRQLVKPNPETIRCLMYIWGWLHAISSAMWVVMIYLMERRCFPAVILTFLSPNLKIKESCYPKLKVNNIYVNPCCCPWSFPLLYAFLLVSQNISAFETTISHLWNTDIWSFNGITGNFLLHGSSNGKFGTCMELFNDIYASPLLTPSPNVSTFCCSILLY